MSKIPLPIANPHYVPAEKPPSAAPPARDVMGEIGREVHENAVFLYMKGSPHAPRCGFSARVVEILDGLGVEYGHADVLADPEKREAVKVYSDWPTIPQLYVRGEFVGGCDIVTEMYSAGELKELLGVEG